MKEGLVGRSERLCLEEEKKDLKRGEFFIELNEQP